MCALSARRFSRVHSQLGARGTTSIVEGVVHKIAACGTLMIVSMCLKLSCKQSLSPVRTAMGKRRGRSNRAGQADTSTAAAAAVAVHDGAALKKQLHGKASKLAKQLPPASNAEGEEESQEEEEEEEGSAKRKRKRKRKEVVVGDVAQELLCFCTTAQPPAVRVGTSGYSYKHWRPGFYAGLPQRLEWERYAKQFDFLELNSTFYGNFDESVYDSWRIRAAATRPSFEYVLKAQQFFTHRKRLAADKLFVDRWAQFWARCQRLRPHLGPVLFQLPSNMKTTSGKGNDTVDNIERLRGLGAVLPAGQKFVIEFRDASWFCQEVYDVLKEHDWCLAITHCTDAPHSRKLAKGGWIGSLGAGPNPAPEDYPMDCCSWGVYVRFHGSEGQYCGRHGAQELKKWAGLAKEWAAKGRCVWFAFNNDAVPDGQELPAAISDCQDLSVALRRCGLWPS